MAAVAASAGPMACDRAAVEQPVSMGEVGQWIWSETDAALYADAMRAIPGTVATVWIGSVHATRGTVTSQLALDPRIAGVARVAVVIRFEDSFTRAWALDDSTLRDAVATRVSRLLRAAAATGIEIAEVQLDYDCPDRLLERWSGLLAHLSAGPLAGRTVWLTSLVSHLRVSRYGDHFRPYVAGHILQLFDTGDRFTSSYADEVARLATRGRMPFRLGVAAFEREAANGRTTEHRAWFGALPVVARNRWYRGVWVFPGGRPWVPLLE